jgi:mycothiol synthase
VTLQATEVLPDTYTIRAPEPADAEGIFDLVSAYNTAVAGVADCTLSSVADRLVEPGFDRKTDGFLVLAEDGLPVGYATAFAKGDRQAIEIEVASQQPKIAAWLFDRTLRRAQEMGRESGHAEITVDICVFRADESLRTLLADHDFTTGTTYHQMRIDHTGPVATPEAPAGVTVRRGAYDDATRWTAHEIVIECFSGQYNFTPRPHDEWIEYFEASSTFDWSQFTLLEVDGRAVAVRICNDGFIETDNCGYIGTLVVLEEFRGRGLAKYLLRDAFARDAADGRAGTILHVDTNNPTPALGLYLSVGMTATLVFDGWRKLIPVA